MSTRRFLTAAAVLMASAVPQRAMAGDVIKTNIKDEWFAMVGEVTVIDFTGFEEFEFVTDQYAELGAVFLDGNDYVLNSPATYENDGWGCRSFPTPMFVHFATPQHWVAMDFAGSIFIRLYFEGEFMSAHLFLGSPEQFGGLVSSSPFDEVEFVDGIADSVDADDIYFGPRLPGDANGDAQVDVADLIDVILGWGPCAAAGPCPPDVTEDGEVDVADVLEVVLGWGG